MDTDPLAELYAKERECSVCLLTKPEHEFAYSVSCVHVFCKTCIENDRSNRCMMCRAPIIQLLHVTKYGSLHRIGIWREINEERDDSIRLALDIANIALFLLERNAT